MRDVEAEIANLEGVVDDPDLLRELILQKLTLAFKDGVGAERSAAAIESSPGPPPARGRGRPKGSKNKPKEAAPAPGRRNRPSRRRPATTWIRRRRQRRARWLLPRPSQRRRRTTAAFPGFCGAIRPSSRCNHEHRTLYVRVTRRAPHARRKIRLLLILSCDFFSRQRTRNRNLVA